MSPRKISFFICIIISALCLLTGYGIAGQWLGALAAILIAPAWLLARKHANTWLPLISLSASVGLAVTGRLIGSPAISMIFGSGFSLAAWDLLLLDNALESNSSGEQTRQYENKHIQSLALALGSGLLVTFLGRLLNLQIPFMVSMLFIAFIVFGLDRIWSHIKKAR